MPMLRWIPLLECLSPSNKIDIVQNKMKSMDTRNQFMHSTEYAVATNLLDRFVLHTTHSILQETSTLRDRSFSTNTRSEICCVL